MSEQAGLQANSDAAGYRSKTRLPKDWPGEPAQLSPTRQRLQVLPAADFPDVRVRVHARSARLGSAGLLSGATWQRSPRPFISAVILRAFAASLQLAQPNRMVGLVVLSRRIPLIRDKRRDGDLKFISIASAIHALRCSARLRPGRRIRRRRDRPNSLERPHRFRCRVTGWRNPLDRARVTAVTGCDRFSFRERWIASERVGRQRA